MWFINDLDYLNCLAFCILMNGIQTFGCSLTGTRTRTVSLMGLSRYTSTYLIGSRYWTPDPPFRPDCTLAISEKQKKKYHYYLIFRLAKKTTGNTCLMRISLLRILLLRFFKTITMILLSRFYGLFILLAKNLADAIFGQCNFYQVPKVALGKNPLTKCRYSLGIPSQASM